MIQYIAAFVLHLGLISDARRPLELITTPAQSIRVSNPCIYTMIMLHGVRHYFKRS